MACVATIPAEPSNAIPNEINIAGMFVCSDFARIIESEGLIWVVRSMLEALASKVSRETVANESEGKRSPRGVNDKTRHTFTAQFVFKKGKIIH